jgi:3-oxoacyl-[acyl-carrier protein] reductase
MTTITDRLSGKVALVTGGSRGIGAAIALRLAKEGTNVAITYVKDEQKAMEVVRAIESSGGKAISILADNADSNAIIKAVSQTVSTFGHIDILVNNAGFGVWSTIDQFSLEDFDRLIAVNIRGVFVASQEAARYMNEGGRIITIGSINAERMPFAGGSVYALTKAAISGFTRGLARDLGPRGITVNNVQPGPVDTDLNPAVGGFSDLLRSFIALGRYGEGDEIASFVSYLASPEASFITGASLNIDGGFGA